MTDMDALVERIARVLKDRHTSACATGHPAWTGKPRGPCDCGALRPAKAVLAALTPADLAVLALALPQPELMRLIRGLLSALSGEAAAEIGRIEAQGALAALKARQHD